jgi:hypothetical protein
MIVCARRFCLDHRVDVRGTGPIFTRAIELVLRVIGVEA